MINTKRNGEIKMYTRLTAIVLLFLIISGCGKKQSRQVFGEIVSCKGSVEVFKPEKSKWYPLSLSSDVFCGDSIRTLGNSELKVLFMEDNHITLAESTTVYVQESVDSSEKISITVFNAGGKILSELKSLKEKDIRYLVQTPTAHAYPEGTHFLVFFAPVPFVTNVKVLHGRVKVLNPFMPGVPVVVVPGFHTVVKFKKKPLVPKPLNYGQFKKMHRILGPKAYKHYSVRFKIKPNRMMHSSPIVPAPVFGRAHFKKSGQVKGKVKVGPKGVSVKAKPKIGKGFKTKFKGKKVKGRIKGKGKRK